MDDLGLDDMVSGVNKVGAQAKKDKVRSVLFGREKREEEEGRECAYSSSSFLLSLERSGANDAKTEGEPFQRGEGCNQR